MNTKQGITRYNPLKHQGVGARLKNTPPLPAGGGYLQNCSNSKTQPLGTEKIAPPPDLFFALEGATYLEEIMVPVIGQRAKPVPEVLKNIKLAPVWQRVAAEMGTKTFLELWAILDKYGPREGDRVRVDLPSRTTLSRLQRNAFVNLCASQGLEWPEIIKACKKQGYKGVSERSIQRNTSL
jgi:hypothetical protein